MKKIGLMLALLWVICALSWATSPNARIKGQLIDASTNQVINYADIFLFTMGSEKPLQQTFPDDQGRFSFTKVAPGNYVVMVRLMGYDVFTKNDIILDASSPVDLGKLMMSPLEVGIAEVEVVAEKRQLVYKLDKKVVEASSNMMGGGGSAVDILENTPSIRVDAEGDVTFRGSSGFLVYIDGKPSVFSGTQALEQVPANFQKVYAKKNRKSFPQDGLILAHFVPATVDRTEHFIDECISPPLSKLDTHCKIQKIPKCQPSATQEQEKHCRRIKNIVVRTSGIAKQ